MVGNHWCTPTFEKTILTSAILMAVTNLFILDTLARSFTTKLSVRVTRWRSARADFRCFIFTIVTIVLAVADPGLPDALTAGAGEFSCSTVQIV